MHITSDSPSYHLEMLKLKENVVNAIRAEMQSFGATECYYNKITSGTGACFVPGTQITVADGGFKLIEDIQVGDLVLTHKGHLRKVVDVMRREVDDEIFSIRVTGVHKRIDVTGEHPFLAKLQTNRHERSKEPDKYTEQPAWIKASKLQRNDIVHSPTYNPGNTSEEIDEETAFLLGVFCAEGFLSGTENPQTAWRTGEYYGLIPNHYLKTKPNNGYEVVFVLNKFNDIKLIDSIQKYSKRLEVDLKYDDPVSSDQTVRIRLNHRIFAKFCKKHCGEGVRTKRISQDLMCATVSIQKAFLAGYLLGDGCVNTSKYPSKKLYKQVVSSTASQQLAVQLFWMMERCGMISSVTQGKVNGGPQYRDRQFDQWKVKLSQSQAKKIASLLGEEINGKEVRGLRFASSACTYGKITDIQKRKYKGLVYNFEVEEDHTYVANMCSVHNCEQTSTAFVLANAKELSFMSQTDQLLMESDIIEHNLSAVWTLGRSYRNEPKAGDGRHLSEFALLEFEAREMDLDSLLKFQQKLLHASTDAALTSNIIPPAHRETLRKHLSHKATIISYTDVLKKLNQSGMNIKWGEDFTSEIEHKVCEMFSGPVQVTHYPESIKFFNMYRTDRNMLPTDLTIEQYNENKWSVECCDVLLPIAGESFGGSQREEIYNTLHIKLRESRMFKQMCEVRANYTNNGEITKEVEDASWKPFAPYIDLFKKHSGVTRSGFGLGLGRLVQYLVQSSNVIPF